jgi:hypothetical protein|tara:strand:- start:289 stop:3069 length:2781 start_codon:yes stop_codon:yes gene_type:complete
MTGDAVDVVKRNVTPAFQDTPPRLKPSTPFTLWWLRFHIFASHFPGLRDAMRLVARTAVACVLVLFAARVGAAFGEADETDASSSLFGAFFGGAFKKTSRWRRAETSLEVYKGATALVLPFLVLPVYTALHGYVTQLQKIATANRTPRYDAEFVFLNDARGEAAKRTAREANASRTQFTFARHTASAREGGDSRDDRNGALKTLARYMKRSGGEDAADWLKALMDEDADENATTCVVFVRDGKVEDVKRQRSSRRSKVSSVVDTALDDMGGTAGRWSSAPYANGASASGEGDDDLDPIDDGSGDSSSAATTESESESESSSEDESADSKFGKLVAALVVHVVHDIHRSSIGPPVSVRGQHGWRGDASRFYTQTPEFVSVAFVEVPHRNGVPGVFVRDFGTVSQSSQDTAAAIAAVAPLLARQLGTRAVVFPNSEHAPTPFLNQSLAGLGAHAVRTRPANDPGFVLRLTKTTDGGDDGEENDAEDGFVRVWDGKSCGKHRRARKEYRRKQRRFAEAGGVVSVSSSVGASLQTQQLTLDHIGTTSSDSQEPPVGKHDDSWQNELVWCSRSSPGGAASTSVVETTAIETAVSSGNETVSSGNSKEITEVTGSVIREHEPACLAMAARCGASAAPGGWRVVNAFVRGERTGALVIETRPGVGEGIDDDDDVVDSSEARERNLRRTRKERRHYRASVTGPEELFALQTRRLWVRACWLDATSSKESKNETYRALLRGAVEFAALRGCDFVDLGPGGSSAKRKLGAVQTRATAFVLFQDWTLSAPAGADAVALSCDLLTWASGGGNTGGERRLGSGGVLAEDPLVPDSKQNTVRPDSVQNTVRVPTNRNTTQSSSGLGLAQSGKRAARRAFRAAKRDAAKTATLAARAFRKAAAAEMERHRKQTENETETHDHVVDDEDTDSDDDVVFVDAE